MKLKLKHIAPYLPYRLVIKVENGVDTIESIDEDGTANIDCEFSYEMGEYKPMLRPLASATQEEAVSIFKSIFEHDINKRGMFDINKLEVVSYKSDKGVSKLITYLERDLMSAYYKTYLYSNGVIRASECLDLDIYPPVSINLNNLSFLFENHFDVFGLINKGLAVIKK